MSQSDQPVTQWYLARDGQQFGPVSEDELRKLIELGHLRASDLVWHAGYAEWQPAQAAIDALKATPQPAAPPQPQAPADPTTAAPQSAEPQTGAPTQPSAQDPAAQNRQSLREAVKAAAPRTEPAQTAYDPQYSTGRPTGAPQSDPQYGAQAGAHGYGTNEFDPSHRTDVSNPQARGFADDDDDFADPRPRRRSGVFGKAMAAGLLVAVVGIGGWFGYQNRDAVMAMMSGGGGGSGETPVVRAEGESAVRVNAAAESGQTPSEDVALLKTPLWASIAKAFPSWVDERRNEATQMKRTGQQQAEIRDHLVKAIAKLRRQHANEALAASPNTLRSLASAFLANLQQLTQRDSSICYAYISRGETSPKVMALMNDPQAFEPIQKQLRLTIDAIVDGRDKPNTYLPPRRNDYKVISDELTKMGWTNDDMTLFGDPQALSKADPGKVCQLVTDWFTAQLMVTDPGVQSRLLVQSLRPVVAG